MSIKSVDTQTETNVVDGYEANLLDLEVTVQECRGVYALV